MWFHSDLPHPSSLTLYHMICYLSLGRWPKANFLHFSKQGEILLVIVTCARVDLILEPIYPYMNARMDSFHISSFLKKNTLKCYPPRTTNTQNSMAWWKPSVNSRFQNYPSIPPDKRFADIHRPRQSICRIDWFTVCKCTPMTKARENNALICFWKHCRYALVQQRWNSCDRIRASSHGSLFLKLNRAAYQEELLFLIGSPSLYFFHLLSSY